MKAKKSRIIPKKITFQNLWTKIEDCERPPLLFRQIPTYSRSKQISYLIKVYTYLREALAVLVLTGFPAEPFVSEILITSAIRLGHLVH